jgi:tetratricopeptide (TPR) repeat protein
MTQLIPDYLTFEVTGNGLQKSEIMLLDLIATNNWERPIYFTFTSLSLLPFDLSRHVVQEGMTYRLLPVANPEADSYLINTRVMMANMTEKYSWRNLNNPEVNYSTYYTNQLVNPRMGFNALAEALMLEGKNDLALEALHKSLEAIPDDTIPFDISAVETTSLLMALDDSDTALAIGKTLVQRADRELAYYSATDRPDPFEVRKNLFVLDRLQRILKAYGFNDDALKTEGIFRKHYSYFQG